jgi:hypothetical protein
MDIEEKRDGINEIARRAKSRYTAAESLGQGQSQGFKQV